MISATPAILRTRRPMDATSRRAESVTIRNLTGGRQLTQPLSDALSVMRNTARAKISVARTVISTPRDCRKNDRSALPGLWNISLPEITVAPVVIMAKDLLAATWLA